MGRSTTKRLTNRRRRRHGAATKASLSPLQRRLVEVMQGVNFGRIENLVVEGGEPVLDPPPRVVREVKFGGENGPRPELHARDFALKAQVVQLFEELERMGDGVVESVEIQNGLPFRMKFEEPTGA